MIQNFEYISNSIQGLHREKNQDGTLVIEQKQYEMYIIFDGLSSYTDSYKFIEFYKNFIYKNHLEYLDSKANNLNKLLFDAHLETIKQNFDGLSTITGIFTSDELDHVKYFNIGDSRIYKFKEKGIEQITIDDNISKYDHRITRCLGLNSLSIDDCEIFSIEKDTDFLLCTDGFYPLMHNSIELYKQIFEMKDLEGIRSKIHDIQKDINYDDSTYILVKRI